jgi:hypothetical protein
VRFLIGVLAAGAVWAQTAIFPLRDIRPGMQGVGKTVFSGSKIEEFQVEILGVLDNTGPKQSVILARLSGGPLAETGVLQGMSGSPIYIDGKLVGALALAFSFSKAPIAGIRPIEEMLAIDARPAPAERRQARRALWTGDLAAALPPREDVLASGGRMADIATPVSFSGFTRQTIEHFAPQLRALGLEPMQGVAGGGRPDAQASAAPLEPGSMITVQLLSGDLSVGADGTITTIDGDRLYAFGHRFLAVGSAELPFARAEVLTLLPNLSTSFKISATREWKGTITQDRSVGVAGLVGRRSALIPVEIAVRRRTPGAAAPFSYRCEMVNDSVLSPFLLQMAVFSAIDATERSVGASTFSLTGKVEFDGGAAPIAFDNMYSGDFNLPALASLGVASPVAYAMQSGFESLQPKRISLEIGSYPKKRQLQIDQLWTSKREVKPGESVDVYMTLTGDDGLEITRQVEYRVPVGALTGPLQITAAEAATVNMTDYRQFILGAPRSAEQVISFLNGLRSNTKAYLRLWRAEPSYDVAGESLPGAPPSLAMILARSQASLSSLPAMANSEVAEFPVDVGGMVVSGSKTIQVEVKE